MTGAVKQDAWEERTGIKTRPNKCILNANISVNISEKFTVLTGTACLEVLLVTNLTQCTLATLIPCHCFCLLNCVLCFKKKYANRKTSPSFHLFPGNDSNLKIKCYVASTLTKNSR